jgi:quercetin dioxygenase-like cupin family protein
LKRAASFRFEAACSHLTFKEQIMKTLVTLAAMAAAFGAFGSTAALAQTHGDHLMVVPTELKWADVGSLPPGAKLAVIEGPLNEAKPFTFRLKLPANYQIPAHSHSAIEHVTVISGTFNMGTGDKLDTKATRALTAGSVAIMQVGTQHYAWNAEETIVQVHGVGPWTITYVNPADDPRKK